MWARKARLLGAQDVTIAYRRGRENMNAVICRAGPVQRKGRKHRHWMQPVEVTQSWFRQPECQNGIHHLGGWQACRHREV
jgi:NADPH-dependent glutamate synthase beta subunit-like oxidoreductase